METKKSNFSKIRARRKMYKKNENLIDKLLCFLGIFVVIIILYIVFTIEQLELVFLLACFSFFAILFLKRINKEREKIEIKLNAV